jgi:hypothetical protein
LLWYEDKAHDKHKFYTVEAVSRILEKLKIINKNQRLGLYKDSRVQTLFYNNVVILPAYCHQKQYVDYMDRVKTLQKKAFLELRQEYTKNINKLRLLRDYRISLTETGKLKAISLLEKYKDYISQYVFLEALEELYYDKPHFAMAAIVKKYKDKVRRDTRDEF